MKEERKRAKKLMQEQSLPYNAWGGNLTIPIMTIVTVILSLIGFKNSFFSLVLFFAAIVVAFVFFFMTANQIKKQFPTMKADSLAARQAYQETIARLKNQI